MIFHRSDNGADEIKKLLGFIYKSINFENLKTYIEMAERDIIKVISKNQFNQAFTHYLSDDYDQLESQAGDPAYAHLKVLDDLVKKIQLPVALHAYRMYVQSNDVTHSDKGRQIFVSENEKPAFEWQIEKDNENMLQLAHTATDILLEYLYEFADWVKDGDTDPWLVWSTTDQFTETRALFVNSAEEFDWIFPINRSRYTYLSLVPFIRRVQDQEIRSCFLPAKWDELLVQFKTNTVTPANLEYINRIKQPLALLSMSIAVKRLSSVLLPDGIFSNVITGVVRGRNSASKTDRNEIAASIERDGRNELVRLQEYIKKITLQGAGEEYSVTMPSDSIDETMKFVRI